MQTLRTSADSKKNQLTEDAQNKYIVSELHEVIHEEEEDLNLENVPEHVQEAMKTIYAYKRRQDEIAYNGTTLNALYYFLGAHLWEDRLTDYSDAAVKMLATLCDTEINQMITKKMGEYSKGHLIALLRNIPEFMNFLDSSNSKPLFEIMDLLRYYDENDERIGRLKEEYKERLEISLSRRHRFA